MSSRLQSLLKAAPEPSATGLAQRALLRSSGRPPYSTGSFTLGHGLASRFGGSRTGLAFGQPGDRYEQEADRIAERALAEGLAPGVSSELSMAPSKPALQRAMAPASAVSAEAGASPAGLIVEDSAAELAPGQMRKSDFLTQLGNEVYAVADEILPTVGRSAQGCPYITNWIGYAHTRGGGYVETFIRRFAPGADHVAAAGDYIPLVGARVRSAMLVWARTGEITGVPEGMASELPDTNQMGAVESLGAQVVAEGEGPTAEGVGPSPQLKANEGGPSDGVTPQAIQRRLGEGTALDSGVRARMEMAFGHDFSRVRIHRDAGAAHLSTRLNARAFTIGHDVAFAAGEYKPGTLVGDALLAHELAHVVQQGGGRRAISQKSPDLSASDSLEEDADKSAIGAVVALWGRAGARLSGLSENVLPSMRSGLRLSRCDSCRDKSEKLPDQEPEGGGTEGGAKEGATPDAGAPKQDAGQTQQPAPAPTPGTTPCASSLAPDKVIVDHRVEPSPAVIEKPGDKVKFTVTFACTVVDDSFSRIVDPLGKWSTGVTREKLTAKGQGQATREWDGKKPFGDIGKFLADDGDGYIHRMEPIKYGYKYNSKTKKTEDLKTTGPKHDSPPVKIAALAHKGTGADHFHFTTANVDALAAIIESEIGVGNDAEKKAIAWAVRNQMIKMGTAKVEEARDQFKDAHDQVASAGTKTIAEEILKKPMSDDITGGAVKWFSPRSMPKKGDSCADMDCKGGLITVTDDAGKAREAYAPGWHKTMGYVTPTGVREWYLRLYKLI
jgi:uncharacterized protein DUF4157